MTGNSSEFLKAQMVVQRFRPRYFGDLGAAAYPACGLLSQASTDARILLGTFPSVAQIPQRQRAARSRITWLIAASEITFFVVVSSERRSDAALS